MTEEELDKKWKDLILEWENFDIDYQGVNRAKELLIRLKNFVLEARYYNIEFGDFNKKIHNNTEMFLKEVEELLLR